MRYRFLIMIAVNAVLGFLALLPGTTLGLTSFNELSVVSGAFMALGIFVTVAGFALIVHGQKKDTSFFEHFVIAGLIVGAFGLSIMPFSHQKILVVPMVVGLSGLMAMIIPKVRARKHDGLQGLPIFIACVSGPAALWALAAGFGSMLSALLLAIGLTTALCMSRLQPVMNTNGSIDHGHMGS